VAVVEVMPGDIKLANGNPDAVFTAIHPNFYPDAAPYLLPASPPYKSSGEADRGQVSLS